jgi:hypothetical protein
VATVRDTFHQKKTQREGYVSSKKTEGDTFTVVVKLKKLIGPEWCDPDIDGIAP